ncbi:MAG: MBL fold metallo-hydrolase [Verrucomicrobiales bacterium]|nr:MBL fold metallo-hydrolase [Verrucomicrobiales bacterium]
MNRHFLLSVLMLGCLRLGAQVDPVLANLGPQPNGDVEFQLLGPGGASYQVDVASELGRWSPFRTLTGAANGTNLVADSGAPYAGLRWYRAMPVTGESVLTGDHWPTPAGDVVIHPVNHASFVLQWNGRMIYNDPVGGSTPYKTFPKADLILVSHDHGDHFNATTLNSVTNPGTRIIAPAAVYAQMSAALKAITIPLANGGTTNVLDLGIEAIPAYNGNHPKGVGNGYVVTVGGRRMFMSGDTGNIPEMRALKDIDVAFVCMNLPFTMSITDAATAVRAFAPRVVYPYHFRDSSGALANLTQFRQKVGTDLGIEVRVRKWY